jgi:peptidoglycan-N-acetylglucosamine deacetylase
MICHPLACENKPVNPWVIDGACALGLAAGATAYGAVYPRAQLFGPTVSRTNSPGKLAITFDDGPNPAITPKLLDLLDRYEARATFFLIGRFVRDCPGLVRETLARGHLLGNHTDNHPNLFWFAPAQIREQIRRCNEAIEAAAGAVPGWFRPPFGMRNPWLAAAARESSLQVAMWTLIPGDWMEKPQEWLIRRMRPIADHARNIAGGGADVSASPTGDILCLHDGAHRGLNGNRLFTLAALEYWLPRWRDLGLQFVTMDEAVRAPAA